MSIETKKYVQYLLTLLLFTFSACLWTLRDSFSCTGGTDEDCSHIRKNLSCRNKLVNPMWGTMTLTITRPEPGEEMTRDVYVNVFCGWETASS